MFSYVSLYGLKKRNYLTEKYTAQKSRRLNFSGFCYTKFTLTLDDQALGKKISTGFNFYQIKTRAPE